MDARSWLHLARLLAQAVGPEREVVGIDPSPDMIRYANRQPGRASNCQFQVGTAEALEFPAERLDVVVSSLVIRHLPEDLRGAALQEMRRVLRAGGKLLVAEAQTPRYGLGWRVLGRVHGFDRMARMVPNLDLRARHNRIALNIAAALLPAARAAGCRVVGSDQRLQAGESLYSYPDLQVLCDPTDDAPADQTPPVCGRRGLE